MRRGKFFEDLACEYLKKKKFKILERNYRCPFGEIDIIAQRRGVLSFVEVKKRRFKDLGDSKEILSEYKKKRIKKTSLFYLYLHRPFYKSLRYSLILIEETSQNLHFHFLESAFDYE